MSREMYMKNALSLLNNDKISEEVYDSMISNADVFCDEEDDDNYYQLPRAYAEIEYDDFDSCEANEGARFDDMNYLRYTER